MPYKFAKHLLLRMPVKSPADFTAESQLFLNDDFFLSALKLASPTFFASLERRSFQSAALTDKEGITLRKYINRYCFRPTPFGLFASVTLMQWTNEVKYQGKNETKFKTSIHTDQTYQTVLSRNLLDNELALNSRYEANPSIYRVINEYRFFRTGLDDSLRQREYQLQSIAFSRLLKDLFAWSNNGRSRPEIVEYIEGAAGCNRDEGEEYADFLIDTQLMVNRLRKNITGPDYLSRLIKVQSPPATFGRLSVLNGLINHMLPNMQSDTGSIQRMGVQLKGLLPETESGGNVDELSAILYGSTDDQGIISCCQKQLLDGLHALNVLSPKDHIPAMSQFISSYQQRFEGQTLPLLQALDPETGIGYQQAVPENNPLLETLQIVHSIPTESTLNWTAAHSYLLECWLKEKHDNISIILQENDLRKLKPSDEKPQQLGLSVLFRIIDEKIFIESAGGNNAPALMGRFTVIDHTIHQAAKDMARQLELQNPHVIFAELLQLTDPHVDNVNRRECIYQYELPITASSILPREHQLELSDLYISIENNMAILYSKKHEKVVVPRLTSAYNHSLNKLPLFRFLADLPYQYSRYNLGFDLKQYFPDLGFYPRVEYGDVILSLATWILREDQLKELQQAESREIPAAFNKLSKFVNLPEFFSLTEGDQQLVFNKQSDADIHFFCSCIKQKKEVVLKEFPIQKEIRQYNAFLLPSETVDLPYPQYKKEKEITAGKTKRKFIPGSDWLYLKIYAPKIGAGRLLLRLRPLLNRRYQHGKISKWFFIRYEDNAPHIRLRMQVAQEDIGEVLIAFKSKLEDRIQQHVIREYQIDVYSRELERYALTGIEKTEDFFWASSELVMSFLKQARNNNLIDNTHNFALYTMRAIIEIFIPEPEGHLQFCLSTYQQFASEFTNRPTKVELDKKYRELSPGIEKAMQNEDLSMMSGSINAGRVFVKMLEIIQVSIDPVNDSMISYLRSIIHMHLNRLFTDESRKQEMITYYLLYKYMLSVRGRFKHLILSGR